MYIMSLVASLVLLYAIMSLVVAIGTNLRIIKAMEKKRRIVTQKDQRQEDEDDGEGQWEKVVSGKGQNQDAG